MNVDNANWQPVVSAGRLPASFSLSVCVCVSFNIIAYLRAAYVYVCVNRKFVLVSLWFGLLLLLVWSALLCAVINKT